MRTRATRTAAAVALTLAATLVLAASGCGGDEEGESSADAPAAPDAASFPAPDDSSLEDMVADATPADDLVISPAGQVFTEGNNRFGFGVFTVEREQITDAEVALYAAPESSGEVRGPFPARVESLETEAAFTAENTAADPDAAKAVYVTELPLDEPGEWRLVALVDRDGELRRSADAEHRSFARPTRSPARATPRQRSTRRPPTRWPASRRSTPGSRPGRCTTTTSPTYSARSRWCSSSPPPRSARAGSAAPSSTSPSRSSATATTTPPSSTWRSTRTTTPPRLRPQVEAYELPTEPWLFVIDCDGRIDTRIEGAFSVAELEAAIDRVADSC